ncbi:oxidoreductase [Pseudomonas aeruginosa]|nr:oxidoreductase [Pseudomonas aeruginosa]
MRVGSVAGQIARLKGCRVVGIAGGAEKCRFLVEELGFDGAIDYKNEDLAAGLKRECPKGIDVFFDNVGGEILDTVLTRIAFKARIVLCGAISQYNNKEAVRGPANYLSLLVNRARMEGMVVMDYAQRFPEGLKEMATWLAEGKLQSREDIVERPGDLSRNAAQAVQRGKLRQVGVEGLRSAAGAKKRRIAPRLEERVH